MNKTLTMFGKTVEQSENGEKYVFRFGPLEVEVTRFSGKYFWDTFGVFWADQGSTGGHDTAEAAALEAETVLRSIHDALGAAIDGVGP